MNITRAPRGKKEILSVPTCPLEPAGATTVSEVLTRMQGTAFQGRQLGLAFEVWKKMLAEECTIMMGMSGAMVPAGMRRLVVRMIENRLIDCLVSTGANLYHDLHETLGQHHYVGSPHADDAALADERIDRVYDTYASEEEFIANDIWIADFASTLETRPYTSREFLHLLGGHLWHTTSREGILTAAYRANVPIFCPAIADSSIGMALSQARQKKRGTGHIDTIGDIVESANVIIRRPRTASVVLGGGTPKNFINQASVQAEFFSPGIGGHQYALQIVTDVPHFGGASGSTLEEATSWGKVAAEADRVTVHADVTLALPLLATALASSAAGRLDRRRPPVFDLSGRAIVMDGAPLPEKLERFLAAGPAPDAQNMRLLAEVYEYEIPLIREGQTATIGLSYSPGRKFTGKVTYIYPQLDATTRTLKVRVEVPNPRLELKPDMFANVEFWVERGNSLWVPEEAVLDSGSEQLVFVAREGGYFERIQREKDELDKTRRELRLVDLAHRVGEPGIASFSATGTDHRVLR